MLDKTTKRTLKRIAIKYLTVVIGIAMVEEDKKMHQLAKDLFLYIDAAIKQREAR